MSSTTPADPGARNCNGCRFVGITLTDTLVECGWPGDGPRPYWMSEDFRQPVPVSFAERCKCYEDRAAEAEKKDCATCRWVGKVSTVSAECRWVRDSRIIDGALPGWFPFEPIWQARDTANRCDCYEPRSEG